MAKKTTKEELEITVKRTWPLHNLKTVQIKILGKDLWHNDITLDKDQAEDVYLALHDILEKEVIS